MNRTNAPKKQSVPFAVNGSREDLLATTPAGDNTASYDAGFPPVTMILKAAGGLPPKGQDMNQILYELSNLARWSSAGAINSFDSAFATAIGGYPKGAVLLGTDGTSIFVSTIENNSNNPNSVTTGWINLSKVTAIASLSGGANKLPYFTGADTAAQTDLTKVGRDIIGKLTVDDVLTYLGLGDAAKRTVGTGAGQLPDMSSFGSGTNWFLLPSGHMVQFFPSSINAADTNGTNAFYPIKFPNEMIACSVLWSDNTATAAPTFKVLGNLSTTTAVRLKTSATSGIYGLLIIAVGR